MSDEPQTTSEPIVGLERTRSRLEQESHKIQDSLLHWQTWEAEYEGFKEEILALGDDHTKAELHKAGVAFEGSVLNEKEIGLLLKDNKGQQRSSEQILGLLRNRIRYVNENVKAVGNILENTQKKVVASQILSQPQIQNEEGLPFREIREELDDDGNVISSIVVDAEEAAPRVSEALREAGLKGVLKNGPPTDDLVAALEKQRSMDEATQKGGEKPKATHSEASMIDNPKSIATSQDANFQAKQKPITKKKKGVAFAEGTKKEDAPSKKKNPYLMGYSVMSSWDTPSHKKSTPSGSANDAMVASKENIPMSAEWTKNIKDATCSGHAASPDIGLGNSTSVSSVEPFSPVVLTGESAEDALLRYQMLKYNMEDVGAVVAEIDLEDEADWSGEGEYEGYDEIIGDEDDDEENEENEDDDDDEFGRTKRRVIDDRYRMEMLELEKRLNQTVTQNLGRDFRSGEFSKHDVGNELLHNGEQATRLDPSLIDQVIFNNVSEAQDSPSLDASQSLRAGEPQPQKVEVSPKELCNLPQSTRKVSHFKASRKGVSAKDTYAPPAQPTCTTKEMLGSTIVERPVPKSSPPIVVSQTKPSVVSSIVEKPPLPLSPAGATIIESKPYTPSTSGELNSPTIAIEPDALEPSLLQHQVTSEYHRMRNRMIQRQGGFLASAEEEASGGVVRLDEEEGGKKVSRFKAARLRNMG